MGQKRGHLMPDLETSRGAARAPEATTGPSFPLTSPNRSASFDRNPTGKAAETPRRSQNTATFELS